MRARLIFLFCFLSVWPMATPAQAQICVNPEGVLGSMVFNYTHGVFQGCTQSGWQAFHVPVCPDGDECAADAFSFADQTDTATSTLITSNIVQITGLSVTGVVSIMGDGSPEFRVCSASDCSIEITTWGAANATIESNNYLQLRLTSSASDSTLHSATVTVNGMSDQWDITTDGPPGPCEVAPTPGTLCNDGTVFVDNSPDGNVPMFTTQADQSSGAYFGTRGYTTSDNSLITGRANSAALYAHVQAGDGTYNPDDGYVPNASVLCEELDAEGYTDWYLPAQSELQLLYTHRNTGALNGTFSATPTYYWSSSEASGAASSNAACNVSTCTATKSNSFSVRCVRR